MTKAINNKFKYKRIEQNPYNRTQEILIKPHKKQTSQMQRHSYRFYLDKVIQPIKVKMQKLALYISSSEDELPMIPVRRQYLHQFVTQTRMYFNDKELLIYKNPDTRQSYLQLPEFETIITQILTKKLDNKKSYEEINFIDIIEEWIKSDPLIQVFYSKYEDVIRMGVNDYLREIEGIAANRSAKSKIKKSKLNVQAKEKENKNIKNSMKKQQLSIQTAQNQKVTINSTQFLLQKKFPHTTTNTPSQYQPQDTFTEYLQQFFIHYAKKSPNMGKNQQFEKLEQFYTTVNLNKFMLYCKQVGLLKVDKKVGVNCVKKLFVDNQDERHVVEFDGFKKLVKMILTKIYKSQQQISEKGYELIGVKNRKNFVQMMAKVGVLVPLKKVFFAKTENKKQRRLNLELLEKMKEKEKHQQQQTKSWSKQPKIKVLQKNSSLGKLQLQQQQQNLLLSNNNITGGYSNKLKPPNPKQLTKTSSMTSLPTIYSSHQGSKEDKKLQQLLELDVESDDDPYLSRFNDQQRRYESQRERQKQRESQHLVQKSDKNNWGRGVMDRMDKRINNVVRKMW